MRGLGLRRVSSFYVLLAAFGAGGLWLGGGGTVLPREPSAWVAALALGLGAGALLVGASRLMVSRFAWAARLASELRSVVGELGRGEALVVALLSGIGEELLFRGVLQPLVGVWLAALVFGALHIGPSREFWPWPLMALAAGLIFGAMFAVTGSLVAPVVAHATVNFLNLRYLSVADRRPFVQIGPAGPQRAAP